MMKLQILTISSFLGGAQTWLDSTPIEGIITSLLSAIALRTIYEILKPLTRFWTSKPTNFIDHG